jgi:hypothetical protein
MLPETVHMTKRGLVLRRWLTAPPPPRPFLSWSRSSHGCLGVGRRCARVAAASSRRHVGFHKIGEATCMVAEQSNPELIDAESAWHER